jgi:hypothetical protein
MRSVELKGEAQGVAESIEQALDHPHRDRIGAIGGGVTSRACPKSGRGRSSNSARRSDAWLPA